MKIFYTFCCAIISLVASIQVVYANESPTVVMISLDGFRWDYLDKYPSPNLNAIAHHGVRAQQMRPAYPTKTFPNHISLITGLYPTHHGIVDNHFYDKERKEHYSMGDGGKDSTWISGIPLWDLAEMNSVKAATYFWPESDARINGMTPSYYYHYSKQARYEDRIQQIIRWLTLPSATRPHFIAGYFSLVDTNGHRFGPDAPETAAAVKRVDDMIGLLRAGLKQQVPYPVNLIVVSDHGMAAIDPNQVIDYQALPVSDDFEIVNSSTRLMLYAKPGVTDAAIQAQGKALAAVANHRYRWLTAKELAAQHYVDSPRIADIILETQAPRFFDKIPPYEAYTGGMHGYIYTKDMGALFVAEGPAFKSGVVLPPFDNVDVYPLVAHILNLPLHSAIDGTLTPLLPALH